MGEIRVKSENLVESFRNTEYTGQYRICLLGKLDIKPSTSYTISFIMEEGAKAYFNEYIFPFISFTGTGQRQVLNITTIANIDKNISTWVDEYGWILCKNMVNNENPCNFREVMILEGTYTSETIPPYQPYFLNLPAHEKTADGWKDIPTHVRTATGWQGELTSQSPLEFKATGQSLLDWRVNGKTSGNLWDGTIYNLSPASYPQFAVDENGYMYSTPTSPDYRGWTYQYSQIRTTLSAGAYTFAITGIAPTLNGAGCNIRKSDDTSLSGVNDLRNRNVWVANFTLIETTDIGVVVKILDGKYHVQILEGTYTTQTIPPYEPYGGVGDWDETEQKYKIPVNVRGRSLYSGAWEQGYWAYSNGSPMIGQQNYVRTAKISCKSNTPYKFNCSVPDGSADYGFLYWDKNGSYIGYQNDTVLQNTPIKFTAISPNNAAIMAINIGRIPNGTRVPADILSFDLYELHETNLYTDAQLMDGDSLEYTTDQTSIPITHGDNTLTVDTAVQPSKVFVKFEG